MTIMDKLDVVNDCLAILGELPLNTLEEDHGFTAAALNSLERANSREQAKQWWFNQETVTLSPDPGSDDKILIPLDAIRVDPVDGSQDFVQRGRYLYKQFASASEDKTAFTRDVICKLTRLVKFEDLPHSAQLLVAASAKLDFGKSYDADRTRNDELKLEYRDAYTTLNAEHIRNINANLLHRPSVNGAMFQIGGPLRRRYF